MNPLIPLLPQVPSSNQPDPASNSAFRASFFPEIKKVPFAPKKPAGTIEPWFMNRQTAPGISTDRTNVLDYGWSENPIRPWYIRPVEFITRPILFLTGAGVQSVTPRLTSPEQSPSVAANASQSLAQFQNQLYQTGLTGGL